ncbi:glycoside hydrolase [Echria macrotheca]|uniref:lytic cellulose monooxygenase (C4-dehydrogenating) n=1 Tax=Echria macrotheca TaxID=438768 RepID=A0AAJ0B8A0_9PEZI|nr:glycoside hydrolase [Echria macrotheca]
MLFSATFSAVALLAADVAAHGAVTSYIIDGKTYPGYQGFSPANSKNVIQRQWSDYNPIFQCSDAKMRCNGGTSATMNATVPAGGDVAAVWQQWTHSQGPILVWLYKCPGAFSSCTGEGVGWFKIDEAGFHGDGVKVFLDTEKPSGWDIAKLVGGGSWKSTIPKNLAPGNYLMRHELIALHQANNPQFYPECAQIVVTGSGTGEPDSSYKAAIPGYCKQSDPNIKVPINDHSLPQTYKVPGPPVWGKSSASKARSFEA